MKELSENQMEAISGGISDQAAMCGTLALFGGLFASNPASLITYLAAGAIIGCFG